MRLTLHLAPQHHDCRVPAGLSVCVRGRSARLPGSLFALAPSAAADHRRLQAPTESLDPPGLAEASPRRRPSQAAARRKSAGKPLASEPVVHGDGIPARLETPSGSVDPGGDPCAHPSARCCHPRGRRHAAIEAMAWEFSVWSSATVTATSDEPLAALRSAPTGAACRLTAAHPAVPRRARCS